MILFVETGIDLTIIKACYTITHIKNNYCVNVTMYKRVGAKINTKINYVNNVMVRTSNFC